jgi:ElaB/YqjD/DUF883 family membrane-anchored ribosome-binding protein
MINRLPKNYAINPPKTETRRTSSAPAAQEAAPGFAARALSAAGETVGSRPVASLGVAFAVGVLLGKLVKR